MAVLSVLGFVFPVLLLGLILVGILAMTNGRWESDPSGRRPYTIYLVLVAFVGVVTVLFALFAMASALTRLAVEDDAYSGRYSTGGYFSESGSASAGSQPPPPTVRRAVPGQSSAQTTRRAPLPPPSGPYVRSGADGNEDEVNGAVVAGLVALAAALVLAFHARLLRALVAEGGFENGPGRRPYVAYLYATCFVTVTTAAIAGAMAVYGMLRIIAPGSLGTGPSGFERDQGIVTLVSSGVLALAAGLLFRFHWSRSERFRLPAGAAPTTGWRTRRAAPEPPEPPERPELPELPELPEDEPQT